MQNQFVKIDAWEFFKEVFTWVFAFLKMFIITIGPAWKYLLLAFLFGLVLLYIKRIIDERIMNKIKKQEREEFVNWRNYN